MVGASVLGDGVPGPCIGKRFFLCKRVADEGVIVTPGVEGWIGADEVNAFVVQLA